MSEKLNRREFFKKSVLASAGITGALSLEEKNLLAQKKQPAKQPADSVKGLPRGKIGKLKISRINLRGKSDRRLGAQQGPDLRIFAGRGLSYGRKGL